MAEAVQPRSGLLKVAFRKALGAVGLNIWRARGGVFICPTPRSARPRGATTFPVPPRLHLGCGNVRLEGYVNIDIVPTPATDLAADITRLSMFADASVEEIRMDAVLEHLREWHRVLRPEGTLSVSWIPDFDVIAETYVHKRPGRFGGPFTLHEVYRYTHGEPIPANAPEQIHKDLFTRDSVKADLEAAGFEITSIENVSYGDERIALNLNVVAKKPTR